MKNLPPARGRTETVTYSSARMFGCLVLVLALTTGAARSTIVGGAGSRGGNQPCYLVGQVIADGDWYLTGLEGGGLARFRQIYLGKCEIRHEIWVNGSHTADKYLPGGCDCGQRAEFTSDLHFWDLHARQFTSGFEIQSPFALDVVEILDLDGGRLVLEHREPLPAGTFTQLPTENLVSGKSYLVAGFRTGEVRAAYSFRRTDGGFTPLPRFYSWSSEEGQPRIQHVTYVGDHEVKVLLQLADQSIQVVSGTTDVVQSGSATPPVRNLTLRGEGVWAHAAGSLVQRERTADGVISESRISLSQGTGLRFSLERRMNRHVGIEVGATLGRMEVEREPARRLSQSGPQAPGHDQDDLSLQTVGLGVNFHLTPGRRADLYLGPSLDYVRFGRTSLSGLDFELGDDVAVGAKVGVDLPFGGDRWIFDIELQYLRTESQIGGKLKTDWTFLAAGLGYRF